MKEKCIVQVFSHCKEVPSFFKRRTNSLLIMLLLFLSFSGNLSAQKAERTITGKVLSEDGIPIPAATVFLEGTSKGTVTDINGN